MPNLGTIPASIASDTTDPAETADRGAAGFEDTLPCAPQLNPSLHAPTSTQAQHNTSGPGRRSETHEASPDSARHRCLNISLALANPRCARALAALRHLAGARTPWQDPEVERRGRAGDTRRQSKVRSIAGASAPSLRSGRKLNREQGTGGERTRERRRLRLDASLALADPRYAR